MLLVVHKLNPTFSSNTNMANENIDENIK